MKPDLTGWIRAASCLGIVLIASCSMATAGDPAPRSSSNRPTETTSTGNEPGDAPSVANPLDVRRFLEQPCTTLTKAQLESFDITRPGIPTTTGAIAEKVGPFCTWLAAEELASSTGVGFEPGNRNGLSDSYRARDEFAYFIPTTVSGYPAVFMDRDDLRPQGLCVIVVGITDTLAFSVSEDGELDQQRACDRAKQVAAAALATMKGSS